MGVGEETLGRRREEERRGSASGKRERGGRGRCSGSWGGDTRETEGGSRTGESEREWGGEWEKERKRDQVLAEGGIDGPFEGGAAAWLGALDWPAVSRA